MSRYVCDFPLANDPESETVDCRGSVLRVEPVLYCPERSAKGLVVLKG